MSAIPAEKMTHAQTAGVDPQVVSDKEIVTPTSYTTSAAAEASPSGVPSSAEGAAASDAPTGAAAAANAAPGKVILEGIPTITSKQAFEAFIQSPALETFAGKLSSEIDLTRALVAWFVTAVRTAGNISDEAKPRVSAVLLPAIMRGLLSQDEALFKSYVALAQHVIEISWCPEFAIEAMKKGLVQLLGLSLKNKKSANLATNQNLVRALFVLCHAFSQTHLPPAKLMSWVLEYIASPPCAPDTIADALVEIIETLSGVGQPVAPQYFAPFLRLSTLLTKPELFTHVGNTMCQELAPPRRGATVSEAAMQAFCRDDCIENFAAGMRIAVALEHKEAFFSMLPCLKYFAMPLVTAADMQRAVTAGILDSLLTHVESAETIDLSSGLAWQIIASFVDEPTIRANAALSARLLAALTRDLVTVPRTAVHVVTPAFRILTNLTSGEGNAVMWAPTPAERSAWLKAIVHMLRYHHDAPTIVNAGVQLVGFLLAGMPRAESAGLAMECGARAYMKSIAKSRRSKITNYDATWNLCRDQ